MNVEAGEPERSLLDRHRSVMPRWLSLYYAEPIELVRGSGRTVWDAAGNAYLDCFGGILTTMTGHDLPEVVEAIREQAGRILHTSTLYLIRPMVELAEMLAALAPIPNAKVFFTNSGSEANDAALLLATNHRRSNEVLALRNSYHGRSLTTMAVTGNRSWSNSSFSGLAVSYVHNGDRLRGVFRGRPAPEVVAACVDDLRDVIDTATSGDVACLMAEAIQGVGGFHVLPEGLLAGYREVLDEHGILLVCDEVQTAWGRTGGHFWGCQAHDVVPDVITFAKGLGNGVALGGVIARREIMDSLRGLSISTFGGNPLATAAGLANLRYVLDNGLQANAAAVGGQLRCRLDSLIGSPAVFDVRGKGLMQAVELVEAGTATPAPKLAGDVLERCRAGGVLIGKGGLYGNVLRISPPLSITAEEAERAADVIVESVRDAAASARGA